MGLRVAATRLYTTRSHVTPEQDYAAHVGDLMCVDFMFDELLELQDDESKPPFRGIHSTPA